MPVRKPKTTNDLVRDHTDSVANRLETAKYKRDKWEALRIDLKQSDKKYLAGVYRYKLRRDFILFELHLLEVNIATLQDRLEYMQKGRLAPM